ncbi:MAG: rRNA pseudouridine synthase [Atopobiaceae bacterium]|nr:rRNA pseudouridine synthase [Atopobiaceae bacterium]
MAHDEASSPQESPRIVPMRLQKFLSRAGVASRRGSENLMTAGRVCVNGEVVTELGSKVDPLIDTVTVDGREVTLATGPVYLVLHKPAGYLTTMSDPYGRPCVAELVPTQLYPGLFPVGRLDCDTTGALLFTTDGEAGNALLHPSRHVEKHYVAQVKGKISEAELERLRHGLVLDDGPCAGAENVEKLDPHSEMAHPVVPNGLPPKNSVVGLSLREGRKRQVKRMLMEVGHPVVALHRDSFGPVMLKGITQGRWRLLTADEKQQIQALVTRGDHT